MLLVKTSLKPSSVHGLGLFAEQFIPKGTRTWEFNPYFDQVFTQHHINSLSEEARRQVYAYGYKSKTKNGYVWCSDTAKHMNHSGDPNIESTQVGVWEHDVATRDIQIGEELTCNYESFDEDWDKKILGVYQP